MCFARHKNKGALAKSSEEIEFAKKSLFEIIYVPQKY